MFVYPADEGRIREVERGGSCGAVVELPPGETLAVGDSVLFALADSRPGQEPSYIKGGDSVRVVLTLVSALGDADPISGRSLTQLMWNRPGAEEQQKPRAMRR